jgi:hypothetical protein
MSTDPVPQQVKAGLGCLVDQPVKIDHRAFRAYCSEPSSKSEYVPKTD